MIAYFTVTSDRKCETKEEIRKKIEDFVAEHGDAFLPEMKDLSPAAIDRRVEREYASQIENAKADFVMESTYDTPEHRAKAEAREDFVKWFDTSPKK